MPSGQSGLFKIVRIEEQQYVSAQCTYIVKKIIAKRSAVLTEQACRATALAPVGRSAKGLRPSAVN
ncbi:MAG: hypothetical protein PVH53_03920 [Desulfobacterales bacterium]|jgi:hypothetical protein